VLAEVARLLRRPVVDRDPPTLRVHAELVRAESGAYIVVLRTESEAGVGQREIGDSACQRIGEAAAVVIALAIDPRALSQPEQSPQPPLIPPRSVAPQLRFSVAPMALEDIGTLPKPSLGVGLSVSVLVRSIVRIELLGSTWLPQDIPAGHGLPGGAHAEMFLLGGLRGCLEHAWGRLELGGCLGLQAGALRVAGFGISSPARSLDGWFDVAVGVGLGLRATDWLAFRLIVEAVPVVDRPVLTVQTNRGANVTALSVYKPSWLVGRASFGPELRF
jgi:hypothetical protein